MFEFSNDSLFQGRLIAMLKSIAGAVIGAACLHPALAFAQGAPATLRGNSVVASWTEAREQRTGDQKEFASRSFPMQLNVYVSNEGRVFARRVVLASNSKRNRSGAASSVDGGGGGQSAQLRGSTITVFSRFGAGARMMRIDFDGNFSSCKLSVIMGRENEGGTIKGHSRVNPGMPLEIKSTSVSGESCSIRPGNVFGQ